MSGGWVSADAMAEQPPADHTTPQPPADQTTPQTSGRFSFSPRYSLAVLGCLGLAIEYCQRVNLSVAIVAMVTPTTENSTNTTEFCPQNMPRYGTETPQGESEKEFSWDKWTQGLVLGAFYWGYATTNILGGRLSEYLSGKAVMGLGMMASSTLSLISPLSAQASVESLVICRIFLGAAQGITFPAMNSLLATWFLPQERSKFSTIVYSGVQLGTAVGMILSGLLASSTFLGGWPSVFYCFGAAGVTWGIAWFWLVQNRPEDHPSISFKELNDLRKQQDSVKQAMFVAVPWKSVAVSLPFWGLVAASLGSEYGFYTLLTELPTYLNDVQHLNLSDNGLLSALPYVLMWLWSLAWAVLMHFLTLNDTLSIVSVRKLSMATALYGAMVGMLVMVFVQCNTVVALCMLCMAGMLTGSISCGYLCSHQDLAPNLAGTLMGVTNTVGALAGIASPTLTGYIIDRMKSLWAWRIVFLISVVVYLVTCTFYLFVISAEVQPWNDPPGHERVRLRRDSNCDVHRNAY